MSFFDKNDFLTTHAYQKKLDKLNAEKAYYEEEITKNTIYLNRLETNPENLEKFATYQGDGGFLTHGAANAGIFGLLNYEPVGDRMYHPEVGTRGEVLSKAVGPTSGKT